MKRFLILPLAVMAILVSFTFWDLPKTFFQQDEWWAFGHFIASERNGLAGVVYDSLLASGKVHAAPLTNLGFYLQYKLFGVQLAPYALVSILTHLINSFLVWLFLKQVTGKKFVSFFAALLFATSSISHQAVTWVSASLNTQGATLFSLVSFLLLLRYLRQRQKKRSLPYASLLSLVVALLFKETLLPFIIWPLLVRLVTKGKFFVAFGMIAKPTMVVLTLYFLFRAIIFFLAQPVVVGLTEVQAQPGILTILYRALTLPLRVLPQAIFPQDILVSWARGVVHLAYPSFITADGVANPYVVESAALDLVTLVLTTLIFSLSIIMWRWNVVFALAFAVGGALPIVFIPGKAGFASIIEPRHLYMSEIGAGLFLALFVWAISLRIRAQGLKLIAMFLVTALILGIHMKNTKRDIQQLIDVGTIRKSLLTTIQRDYPGLPNTIIFYTDSDTAYYGMPDDEKILPVQVGFGHMLLVWYQKFAQFPTCFFEGNFFLDILAEGFRFCDGRGFGYFRQYDKLVKSLRENNLKSDSVVAYSWSGRQKLFTNITEEVRFRLDRGL